MIVDFLNRNSLPTLATGLLCGTGLFQRMALQRKTKKEKGHSHLPVWRSGLRSMKILMGAFVSLKFMLVSLHFTKKLGNVFFQWRVLAQSMSNAQQSLSSIAFLPRIEINLVKRRGLLYSELGRISSISIMPTLQSRERLMQELMEQEKRMMEGSHQMRALILNVIYQSSIFVKVLVWQWRLVNELVLLCVSEYAYTQNYSTLSSYRLASRGFPNLI